MKKKSTKENLIKEYEKRIWLRDIEADNNLLDVLSEVIKKEKEKPRKKTVKRVAKKLA